MKSHPVKGNQENKDKETVRLNKYLANAGIAARRKCDELIKDGLVTVNGKVVREMGFRLSATDVVKFKGKLVKPQLNKTYLLLNKPKDVITTVKDEKGRKTVMDIVKSATKDRIYPVGRLDRATTGLLLITNDGDLAKKLTHPSHGVKKIYHVELTKSLAQKDLQKIAKGVDLEDGKADVDKISYLKGKSKSEIGIELHSGKNRIIRRIFESVGYKVKKLDRVYFGGLTKKDLPRGRYRHLTKQEIIMLKHFV